MWRHDKHNKGKIAKTHTDMDNGCDVCNQQEYIIVIGVVFIYAQLSSTMKSQMLYTSVTII